MSLTPNVSVYEPGQKAVIAWNGTEEILILSTDVTATGKTLALEIMPLPSNPKAIEPASFQSFTVLQELIWRYAPQNYRDLGGKGVEITFHKKIGAHDVTVIRASNASELIYWAEDFLRESGIRQRFTLHSFTSVIEDYMARGFRYFVLDLITVTPEPNSVNPILYRFETSFLYYPLKISSPVPGDTKIIVFLLTDGKIESPPYYPIYHPLRLASFRSPSRWEPIQLNLAKGELSLIDLRIGELFKDNAWLTVLEYDGSMDGLTRDLVIMKMNVANPNGTYPMLLGGAIGALGTLTVVATVLLIRRAAQAKMMLNPKKSSEAF